MLVSELIEELKKRPENYEVLLDAWDVRLPLSGIRSHPTETAILLYDIDNES